MKGVLELMSRGGKTPAILIGLLIFSWCLALLGPSRHTVTSAIQDRLPSVRVDFHHGNQKPVTYHYDTSKIALFIETRPLGRLATHLLHHIQTIPADWPVLFLGSPASVEHLNYSAGIKEQQRQGRLALAVAPLDNQALLTPLGGVDGTKRNTEVINMILTNASFYSEWLSPAEKLLSINTDGVLCANSNRSVDDWLQYDFLSVPGFSMRNIPLSIEILRSHPVSSPPPNEIPYFSNIFRRLKSANLPAFKETKKIILSTQFFADPMGMFLPNGGASPLQGTAWADKLNREYLFRWCPESKNYMEMRFTREGCSDDEIKQKQKAKEAEETKKKAQEEAKKKVAAQKEAAEKKKAAEEAKKAQDKAKAEQAAKEKAKAEQETKDKSKEDKGKGENSANQTTSGKPIEEKQPSKEVTAETQDPEPEKPESIEDEETENNEEDNPPTAEQKPPPPADPGVPPP